MVAVIVTPSGNTSLFFISVFPVSSADELDSGTSRSMETREDRSRPGIRNCSRVYSYLSRLDRGQGNRIHNVIDQGSSGEVIYRASQPLEHRADAEYIRAALDRLVSRIPCIQVRKDEH